MNNDFRSAATWPKAARGLTHLLRRHAWILAILASHVGIDASVPTEPGIAVEQPAGTNLVDGIASTTSSVTFTPSAGFHLANSDADENPFDIVLTGQGAVPGDLDSGFNPNADGTVGSMAVQADGKIVISRLSSRAWAG